MTPVVEAVIPYCAGTVGPQRCGPAPRVAASARQAGRRGWSARPVRRGRPARPATQARPGRSVRRNRSPKPFGKAGQGGRQLTAWKTGTISTMVQLEAEAAAPERRRLPGSEFSAVVAAVTSAFGDPTRRQVYLFVRDAGTGATASQVAQHFSLHPNVARHHLDKLAAGGYLEVFSSRAQVSGVGRPSKFYRASGPAPVLETTRPGEELLLSLLGGALGLLPREEAEKMAEQVGFAYGSKLASSMVVGEGQRSFRSALTGSGRRPHGPWLRSSRRSSGPVAGTGEGGLPVLRRRVTAPRHMRRGPGNGHRACSMPCTAGQQGRRNRHLGRWGTKPAPPACQQGSKPVATRL